MLFSAPYTEAVLMEVERFLHVVPVIGPRRVLSDTALDGYVIPKVHICTHFPAFIA